MRMWDHSCVMSTHWPQQPGPTKWAQVTGAPVPVPLNNRRSILPKYSGDPQGMLSVSLCHPVPLATSAGLLPLFLLCSLYPSTACSVTACP